MKILYVTTISNTMGFFPSHIKMLVKNGHQVDLACNIQKPLDERFFRMGCKVYNLPFSRKPLENNIFSLISKIKKLIANNEYDIVHTHTPIASAIVRLACKNLNHIKVIYTAHGFHFYNGAPLKNWLVYYPLEKILSKFTDILITINKEDHQRSKTFYAKSNYYIPGTGIDTTKFQKDFNECNKIREVLGIPKKAFVILSVGELNNNKNHESIIKALSEVDNQSIYYLIAGRGNLHHNLLEMSRELNLNKNVHLLGYRDDVADLHKISDVFAFPSKREGLGLAAIEAMASGLPLISSNIHGIKDYSINGISGYTFDPKNITEIAESIKRIYNLSSEERRLIGINNQRKAMEYDIKAIVPKISEIYKNIIKNSNE